MMIKMVMSVYCNNIRYLYKNNDLMTPEQSTR